VSAPATILTAPPEATADGVRRALAGIKGRPSLAAVIDATHASREQVFAALAEVFGYGAVSGAELEALTPALDRVGLATAVQRRCLAARDADGKLVFCLADPFDRDLVIWAESAIPEDFRFALVSAEELTARLAMLEAEGSALAAITSAPSTATAALDGGEQISFLTLGDDSGPIVKLVNSSLFDAMKAGATDIHFETHPGGLEVKYRIDGILIRAASFAGAETAEQVISRIKVMAELDIAERRVPQDGRFRATVRSREIDFRVSVMPSIYGEDAVIRILDKQQLIAQGAELKLDFLGFADDVIGVIRKLAREPYGMLLVTGPTGSGKTTTLYAAITEINDGKDKIVTIEDPVEYQLRGVLQIPVNEKKGLTFARGLRSILRHDPDRILVGEIRDPETAEIAVQSALTGHLVFTTVHANNVFDVIGRFTHMGVDPYGFVAALNGIVAQRLVRVLCPKCVETHQPAAEALRAAGLEGRKDLKAFQFRRALGCAHCRGTGYKGRRAIAEILLLNDEIRDLISTRAPSQQVKEAAMKRGTRLLREAAVDLVKDGVTSLEELDRVTLVS